MLWLIVLALLVGGLSAIVFTTRLERTVYKSSRGVILPPPPRAL